VRLATGQPAPPVDLQPAFGLPVRVPSPDGRSTALFFTRCLGSGFGRRAIERVEEAMPDFERAGLQVVVFTRSTLERAREAAARRRLLAPLVADPEGRTYVAYGVGRDRLLLGSLAGLLPPPREAFGFLHAGLGALEAPWNQLPGEVLVDGHGLVAWSHAGRHVFDLPDIDGLLAALR
jgi:peroxiredoxin